MKKRILALLLAVSLAFPSVPSTRMDVVAAEEVEMIYRYTFHFETNGGLELEDYIISSDVSEVWSLPNPTRDGYDFVGWYTDENLENKFNLYECDLNAVYPNGSTINLYAKWEKKEVTEGKTYTITYMLNGGAFQTSDYPTTFQSGDAIVFPVPVREGYEFKGWYVDEGLTTVLDSSMVEDLILYAKWEAGTYNAYPITYVLNGGTNPAGAPTSIEYGKVTELPTPYLEGYTFKGWYHDASFTVPWGSLSIVGPITLYAKWEVNQSASYQPNTSVGVVYVLNGGTNPATAMTSVPANGTFINPTPTRYGYKFAGWYYDKDFKYDLYSYFDTYFISQGGQTGQVTLYAKWDLAVYTVRYHSNGGALSEPFTDVYTIITGLPKLKTTERPGYKFQGWFSDISFKNKVDSIAVGNAGDVDLYALWLYVGNEAASTTPTTPSTPSTNKTDGNGQQDSGTTSSGNGSTESGKTTTTKIIYANTAYEGAKNSNPKTLKQGESITLKPAQRKGYKFLGWTDADGDEVTSIRSNGEEQIYVFAEWEHIKLGVALSIKNVKKQTLKFSWKSTKYAEGVQIQYSTNKKFKKAKKVTYKYKKCKVAKRTYKIKKLKKKKSYYVRFRQYATDSRGKKVYGSWITAGKIKIWK